MNTYLTLIRNNASYRYLWLASVVTMMGDWFNLIGTVVLINRYTNSGTAVAALFLARMLPPLVFGPIAGVLADRLNRKAIMITSDLLRIFIVLGFLLVDNPSEAWLVYTLTIAQFIISSFYGPAQSALTPSLLERKEDLLTANTLSGITWSAMLAVGAALGGLITTLLGLHTALIIDALTFLISAVLLSKIVVPASEAKPQAENKSESGWDQFVAGLHYVIEYPKIGVVTLVKAMLQLGSTDIFMTVYASQIFVIGEDGAITFGLLMTSSGIGAVLGPLVANRLGDGKMRALQNSITVGYILVALSWVLFGLAPTLPLAMAALLLRAMGGSTMWTYSNTIIQMKVPNQFLGRIFALDHGIFTLVASLSIWLTGLALDRLALDPRSLALWVAGISVLPIIVWVLGTADQDQRARWSKIIFNRNYLRALGSVKRASKA
ncbi:MAG: MFS transporter [Chloroflexota bacterium]